MSYLTDVIGILKNVLSEHSEQLAFENQPWYCYSEGHSGHTFYFKSDGKLLVIEPKGETRVGQWELLPNIDAILITYQEHHLTLQRQFSDRAIMCFIKGEEPYYFVNSRKLDEAAVTVARAFLEDYIKKMLEKEEEKKRERKRQVQLERLALEESLEEAEVEMFGEEARSSISYERTQEGDMDEEEMDEVSESDITKVIQYFLIFGFAGLCFYLWMSGYFH